MNKILVIIPAYNEAGSIIQVINSIKKLGAEYVPLVINDGSVDDTSLLAKSIDYTVVIDMVQNVGIGGAVQTGFKYAKEHQFDIAIQFDGDGQHNAQEISKIINPIQNGLANCVIGSRFLTNEANFKSTFTRRLGIKVFMIVNSILIKQKITDNTSGFRAFDKNCIALFADQYPSDYPEPEAVIYLGKKNYIIKEVSVQMNERSSGTSSINGFQPIYYMIKVLLSIFMTYLRKETSS